VPGSDTPPAAPVVRVRGLTVRFGTRTALDAIDVDVAAGSTGLLGANGAGKSTLMRVVLGLIQPDRGRVEVLGRGAGEAAADTRRRLGYMSERGCLPREMTARDLVVHMGQMRGLDRRTAVLRASEVLFQVGLEEERSRLIGTFSTGMAQRTKLAQAIVHSPELVILDEPTNGLDPAGREEMLALVRRLSRDLGIAVIISSHVLDDITATCDAVVVLRAGRVTRAGMLDELARRDAGRGVLVRARGDVEAFAGRIRAAGLAVAAQGDGALEVTSRAAGADVILDAVRDAAADSSFARRELRAAGATLEDALVEALE
jgi:ABC-2 type transport system ATP-binding protein